MMFMVVALKAFSIATIVCYAPVVVTELWNFGQLLLKGDGRRKEA
jgi:hypothetical protein